MRQPDLAQRESPHRHRERLHAAVPGLARDDRQQDRERREFGDGAFEHPDDECGEECGREVDLEPGQPLADRERYTRERALFLAHTDHRLQAHRRLGLGRGDEGAIADHTDETPVAVDDGQSRDPLLREVIDDLLARRRRVHTDRCSLHEVLELGIRRRRRDLAERDGAHEAARGVGEVDRAELLLLERAHLAQRVVDRRLRRECGDPRVHERTRSIEGIREELANLGCEPSRQAAQHTLALGRVEARHDGRGARRVHLPERDLRRLDRHVT